MFVFTLEILQLLKAKAPLNYIGEQSFLTPGLGIFISIIYFLLAVAEWGKSKYEKLSAIN